MTIPYFYLLMAFFVVCGFCRMGQIDEEIGWFLGLLVGMLVVALNHVWPGGYGGLVLNAVGGFVLLTVYKIVRSATERRDSEE